MFGILDDIGWGMGGVEVGVRYVVFVSGMELVMDFGLEFLGWEDVSWVRWVRLMVRGDEVRWDCMWEE